MIVRVWNGTELHERLKPVFFSLFIATRVARRQSNKNDKYLQWRCVTNEVFNCLTSPTDEAGIFDRLACALNPTDYRLLATVSNARLVLTGLSRWAWPEYFARLEHFFVGRINTNIAWVKNKTHRIWMLRVYPKLVSECPHEPHKTFGMSQKLVISWQQQMIIK